MEKGSTYAVYAAPAVVVRLLRRSVVFHLRLQGRHARRHLSAGSHTNPISSRLAGRVCFGLEFVWNGFVRRFPVLAGLLLRSSAGMPEHSVSGLKLPFELVP